MKIKYKINAKRLILLIIMLILVLFFFQQNHHLVVTNYIYESERLPCEFDGYKIVQISDLHNIEFGAKNNALIAKVKECSPDIVVITGDIVDSTKTNVDIAINLSKELCKICPTYYVTGNHEIWLNGTEYEKLLNGLKDNGVNILNNAVYETKKEKSSIYVIGLDDRSLTSNAYSKVTQEINEDTFKILLAHEPQYLKFYSDKSVDLVISGHTHGGQIRLPKFGGLIAPDQEGFFPKYTKGEYTDKKTTMIVSGGLGNSVVPIRLFNYPEIVCTKLQSKN